MITFEKIFEIENIKYKQILNWFEKETYNYL